jgi:hypothetical protein
VHVNDEVLAEVEKNSELIVGDPQGILEQQLGPHPIIQLFTSCIFVFLQL